MIKRDLLQRCIDFSIPTNISMWYTTLIKWRIRIIWSCPYIPKKHLTKSNIHLWQKSLNEVSKEGINLNLIKAIYDKLTSYSMVKNQKLSLQNPEWFKDAYSPLLFNTILQVLARVNRQEKEIKATKLETSKTVTSCRWHDIIRRKS